MRKIAAVLSAALLFGLGVAVAVGQTPDPATAWIDRPLGWVTIEQSPVGILAHVADPAGVGSAVFSVDGRVLEEVTTAGATLEVVEFSWVPEASGVYALRVTGFDTAGARGGESRVTVIVDLGDPPETTTTSSTTPTTTTTTTTSSGCAIVATSAVGPSGLILTETPTLTWDHSGCEPEYFEVQITSVPDFGDIVASDYIPSPGREWTVPNNLEKCDTFWWRVRTWAGAGVGPWSNVVSFEVYC